MELTVGAAGETLSTRLVGRLAGALWIGCGLLVIATMPVVTLPAGASSQGVFGVGAAAVACGVGIWFLPWEKWRRSITLLIIPLALFAIALYSLFSLDDGFVSGLFYLVAFVWLGLAHRQGAPLAFAPLATVAFILPILLDGSAHHDLGLTSAVYVIPCCILLGETVAWVSGRLRRSEGALVVAERRFRNAFEEAPIGMGMATVEGRLLQVNRSFARIIGREPDDLRGVLISDFTHPDDWDANLEEIQALLAGRTDRYQIEKRYQHRAGHYIWVLVSVSCVRDPAGDPLYMIGQLEDITERRALQERLAHAATHDLMTGLPNRVLFMDRLDQALSRVQRSCQQVALMFLDLDRFKMINDSLGHDAGDRMIQGTAQRIAKTLRSSDTLARFGGDEFTVLCEVNHEDEAIEIAQRIIAAMALPLLLDDSELFISASIGIAISSKSDQTGSELLRNADVAMYRAKTGRPGQFEVYRPDDEAATISRLRTSNELHRALDRGELQLHYQPVVDLHTTRLVGVEALVRWMHPTRGLLLPGEFIPLAEDSAMILPLGRWVLAEACRQAAEWGKHREVACVDNAPLNVSVNVSTHQLDDPRFPKQVEEVLEETGLDPDCLWLEITETTLTGNVNKAVRTLTTLRDLGLHIEIDDFGTGYSSLSYLKQFPVETLKIDRSFVAELDRDLDDIAIVRAIIALGDSLRLSVIAEGIERARQATQLTRLGCFMAQGYYFGYPEPASVIGPLPADDLSSWATSAQPVTA